MAETTQVIGTQIYANVNGGAYGEFPLSTAYGLVQGIISLILILLSNFAVKRMG